MRVVRAVVYNKGTLRPQATMVSSSLTATSRSSLRASLDAFGDQSVLRPTRIKDQENGAYWRASLAWMSRESETQTLTKAANHTSTAAAMVTRSARPS